MNKRVLLFVAIILFILIGVGGYYYFAKTKTPTTTPTPQFPGEGQPATSGGAISQEPTATEGEGGTTGEQGGVLPRLFELHKVPVAGVSFVETKDKKGVVTSITARYIERGLGHVYEAPVNTLVETRITNDTYSRLSEALWGNNGKSVVIRSAEDEGGPVIKSRILDLTAPQSSGFLRTAEISLPDSIPFMAVAEDGSDKLFYLENNMGGTVGTTASLKNTGASSVFNSVFTEWLPQFPNKSLITLTTRPSGSVPGYLFFLNPTTKVTSKILGDINGLTTLTSKDGKLVLYSESKKQGVGISYYDVAKKGSVPLSLQTLPEKCVWSQKNTTVVYCAVPRSLPSALYPDQWYQGLVSFTDDIWRIDTKTALIEKVLTGSFDMTNLTLSSDDAYLLFMNKITGTPWVYRLTEDAPLPTVRPATQSSTQPTTQPQAPEASTSTKPITASPIEGMVKLK